MRPIILMTLLGIAYVSTAPRSILAAECQGCGSSHGCQKVCRLVCKEKKVDIVCWGCECEDFCLPKPSQSKGQNCEEVCSECTQSSCEKSVFSLPQTFVWTNWFPCGAKLHTKKKLMKKTISKTIPSYHWVVEDLCPQCEAMAPTAPAITSADIPPLPAGAPAPRPLGKSYSVKSQ